MKKIVIAMFLIMFPFVVSAVLFLFGWFDFENLGFWVVLQSGPFMYLVVRMDGSSLLITIPPLISNLGMIALAFWLREKSWKANIAFYLFVFGWYVLAVHVFAENLAIP